MGKPRARRQPKSKPASTDTIKLAIVNTALQKLKADKPLTQKEQRTLRDWKAEKDEARRWETYESITQTDWVKLSGKTAPQLKGQAIVYGLPFGGEVTDLGKFLKAFHEFLAENFTVFQLIRESGPDPLLLRAPKEEQVKYIRARRLLTERRTDKATLELAEMRSNMMSRQAVEEFLAGVADHIREASEVLERRYGIEAKNVLTDTCESIRDEVTKLAKIKARNKNGNTGVPLR